MSCDLKGFLNNFFKPLFFDRPSLITGLGLREGPLLGASRALQWNQGCKEKKEESKKNRFVPPGPSSENRMKEVISSSKEPLRTDRFAPKTSWMRKLDDLLWDFFSEVKKLPERRPWQPKRF